MSRPAARLHASCCSTRSPRPSSAGGRRKRSPPVSDPIRDVGDLQDDQYRHCQQRRVAVGHVSNSPLTGPSSGNPFLRTFRAARRCSGRASARCGSTASTTGRGRTSCASCPDATGPWSYETRSNAPALDGVSGVVRGGAGEAGAPRAGARRQPPPFPLTPTAPATSTSAPRPMCGTCRAMRWRRRRSRRLADGALHQDPHVRVPQALPLQRERARALSVQAA